MKASVTTLICALGLSVGGAIALPGAYAAESVKDFPTRAVRIVVPYPAGGSTDVMVRMLGDELSKLWGQSVVVENKPGASGVVASEAVLRQPADGYTLMTVVSSHVLTSSTMKNLSFDPMTDLVPVATIAKTQFMLLANPDKALPTVAAVNAKAKAEPNSLNFGIVGQAGMGRMAYEMYEEASGAQTVRVPFQGSIQLLTALAGGNIDYALDVVSTFVPHIKSGRVKALAVTGDKRIPSLPDVPTFAEAGLPTYDVSMWYGVLARKGTPQPIIDKISRQIGEILNRPDMQERLRSMEIQPLVSTAAEFGALMEKDHARYAKIIKEKGIANQ